jgi:hypothetical protein
VKHAVNVVALVVLSVLTTGCVNGIVDPSSGQPCPNPLRGARYALCGHLSTAELNGSTVNGKRVLGSVDSTQPERAGRYTIKGGTFHAYR